MNEDEDKSGKIAPEHSEEQNVAGTTPASNEGQLPPTNEQYNQFPPTNEQYNQSKKKHYEEKHDCLIIDWEELVNIAPDFAVWLKQIIRHGTVDSQVFITWSTNYPDKDKEINYFRCLLFTENHKYTIYGHAPTKEHPRGYLGCGGESLKPRPGEWWHRGNDLPDGDYSKETFDRIVRGIVAYEIKNLQLWRK